MNTGPAPSAKEPLSRSAIIETARRVLSEGGIEQMSLRRLAAELGVTAPALYAHVEDKGDLLAALAETGFDELIDRYEAITTSDPGVRVRHQIEAYIDQAVHDPHLFRVMYLFRPSGIGTATSVEELPAASRAFEAGTAAVDAAIAAGQVHHSHDPMTVALTLWTVAHGLATALSLGVPTSEAARDDLCDTLISAVMIGLREPSLGSSQTGRGR